MFRNGSESGRSPHEHDWGAQLWQWVSDLEDASTCMQTSFGTDIGDTGVTVYFSYADEDNELTASLQVGAEGSKARAQLENARADVEQEITGNWRWDPPEFREEHGCTYYIGTVTKDWTVSSP